VLQPTIASERGHNEGKSTSHIGGSRRGDRHFFGEMCHTFMRYQEAVDHLYARGYELAPRPGETSPREFDLNHMRILAGALGGPQLKFSSILIAGTNGKGSTAATLASILAFILHRIFRASMNVSKRRHMMSQAIASAPLVTMPSLASMFRSMMRPPNLFATALFRIHSHSLRL
jgi:hypothetical protein